MAGSVLRSAAHALAAVAPLAFAGVAQADGLYIYGQGGGRAFLLQSEATVTVGGVTLSGQGDLESGPSGGAAVGWAFGDFRTELEAGYVRGGFGDFKLGFFDVGLNGQYAPEFKYLRPYIGLGAGYSFIDVSEDSDLISDSSAENTFYIRNTIGLDYKLTEDIAVGVNYRTAWSPEIEGSTTIAGQPGAFSFERFQHEFGFRMTVALWSPSDAED